ncbi:guanine nucleotide-binding protein subunit beta-like protein 1 [Anneissia japonica]|uniref:guanine nucleotide-binding protein subunit beta-like protein 1 n=1 Tax=Anneissia japonica TaxID=1529436 RepID=UPI0014255D05|nr:guanine nucleotide-binding protein subunit beta-like protein 1 [Anneissia japonica]
MLRNMARPPPSPLFVLRGSSGFAHSISFMKCNAGAAEADQSILATGCSTGEIYFWNLKTRRVTNTLQGHGKDAVIWVEEYHQNKLISQGRDQSVCIWDVGEGRQEVIKQLPVSSVSFCKCALSVEDNGSHMLATPTCEVATTRLFHLEDGEPICNLIPDKPESYGMVMCMEWISTHQLLVGYEDGTVALWDSRKQKLLSKLKLHCEPVMCIDCSSITMEGISGSVDNSLKLWHIDSTGISLTKEHELTNAGLSDIKIRQDNRIFATGGWDSRIRLFTFKKCKPLAVLDYHTESIVSMAFSSPLPEFDGYRLLAAGAKDNLISIWSLYQS